MSGATRCSPRGPPFEPDAPEPARAVTRAVANRGVRVAEAGEAELLAALVPLAESADDADDEGRAIARSLLLGDRVLVVGLLGTARVTRANGTSVALTALTDALQLDPHQSGRSYAAAEHLLALGLHATAAHLARLGGIRLEEPDADQIG